FCLARMEYLFVGLSHNKPKKSVATAIVREVLSHDWLLLDYICTQGDLALIDFIKEIPCEPRVEVMLIDDSFVERKWMECLFQPNAYLGDEVFIPINIRETHWYLVVIHARNMEIQVLDSLGSSQERKDLTDSIKGLQRQIDMISQRKELKDHKWPDLQVASWPLIEIDMGYAKQTYSSSCGLFLLNYIEYWTGDELSDSFTQDDMSHFRKKMAAILLSSDLNKRRGCLLYKNEKEVDSGSPSDVEILENPTDSNKRKLLHVLDDSEVVYEDEEGPITQADLQRWFVDDWDKRAPVKVSTDGCTNDFLMVGLSTKDMPVTKADSIDVLCDYIMAIEDDTTLERTWVRSFNLFKIEISVKDLQNILTTNQDMIIRCFDMAVRLLANKESRRPKEEIINNRKHYMDMRFWRMVGFGKLPNYHQDPTTDELAKTLDCWPSMNYYITGCRYVLMLWKFNGCHALFVIDHVKKHVTFIDFTPTQDWCKHMPYKRFAEAIIMTSKKYKIAYSKKHSGWAEDIFKWEHTIQTGVPIDLRGSNTSYLVLQAMAMWGNDRPLKFVGVSVVHYFSEGLYTFDIGQNDLAGEFYSRTEDQVIVSIPTIFYVYDLKIKLTVYFSQAYCAEMLVQMDSAFLAIYLMTLIPKIITRKKIIALPSCKFLFRYYPGSLQFDWGILRHWLIKLDNDAIIGSDSGAALEDDELRSARPKAQTRAKSRKTTNSAPPDPGLGLGLSPRRRRTPLRPTPGLGLRPGLSRR
ncbi:hypothetical protein ACJX0J_031941, partial [Zea mays]